MKLTSRILICLFSLLALVGCATGAPEPRRWSGFDPLPLSQVPAGIPVRVPSAAMRIPTTEQLSPRPIPRARAALPIGSYQRP